MLIGYFLGTFSVDSRPSPGASKKRTALAALLVAFILFATTPALFAQNTATIEIDTKAPTRIQRGFSGVNDDLGFPVEYWDNSFNALAQQVHYGWIRFPGGASGDAYNWKTGQVVQGWLDQFTNNYSAGPHADVGQLVAGRGGAHLKDAAARARRLGASLIICVNAFTDTPESIGRLAQYVKENRIPVAAWELANEAYLFTKTNSPNGVPFFNDALDYLKKMQPYAAAIRQADRNATIAIFADPKAMSGARALWDTQIASFAASNPSDVYWDAISFHYYPALDTQASFADWMASESGVLASETTQLITEDLRPLSTPRTRFLVTEFDATMPGDAKSLQPDGTLWGGIYAAEFTMRMSTLPQVMFVGPQEISQYSGVGFNLDNQQEIYDTVKAAAANNMPIDTVTLDNDFNFYLSAQAAGLSVLNSVINRAATVHRTTVTGGPTVSATYTNNPVGCSSNCAPVPALYAMSYGDGEGRLSVVITNKSKTPVTTTININGLREAGSFDVRFVSDMEAQAQNSPTNPDRVRGKSDIFANPVTVPPYSVMRVDIGRSDCESFGCSSSDKARLDRTDFLYDGE
jgi:hypothetical protein